MELTETVAGWSSCYQENRHVGAVIVRGKRVMTTGYNGAPSGIVSCTDRKECLRRKLGIPSGTRQEICYAVHASRTPSSRRRAWASRSRARRSTAPTSPASSARK